MIGSSIYGVAVIDGSLCSRVYGMLQNKINPPKNSFVYSFIQHINDFIQITGLRGDPEEKLAAEWIKWAPKVITYAKSKRSAAIQTQLHLLDGNEEAADG